MWNILGNRSLYHMFSGRHSKFSCFWIYSICNMPLKMWHFFCRLVWLLLPFLLKVESEKSMSSGKRWRQIDKNWLHANDGGDGDDDDSCGAKIVVRVQDDGKIQVNQFYTAVNWTMFILWIEMCKYVLSIQTSIKRTVIPILLHFNSSFEFFAQELHGICYIVCFMVRMESICIHYIQLHIHRYIYSTYRIIINIIIYKSG